MAAILSRPYSSSASVLLCSVIYHVILENLNKQTWIGAITESRVKHLIIKEHELLILLWVIIKNRNS